MVSRHRDTVDYEQDEAQRDQYHQEHHIVEELPGLLIHIIHHIGEELDDFRLVVR